MKKRWLKVCLYLSMALYVCTLQEVIKSLRGHVPIEALHLILDIGQLAQHDSSAWLPWLKWVLSLRSLQLIHLGKNVCALHHSTMRTLSQNQCLLVSSDSQLVFVNRLQLCHHTTFRSSCFYLANPCGALTAPTEVMDDFVCTERGLSTKCVVYCSI